MKNKTLLLTLGIMMTLSSCIREEVIIVEPVRQTADINYSFYTSRNFVEIEGDIINTGNTYIRGAEIRFQLYDSYGYLVATYFESFDLSVAPGDGRYFYIDIPERYIYDVRSDVWSIW